MCKIGDIIMSIAPNAKYYITSRYCIAKVTKVCENRNIMVEVIKSGCEVPEIKKNNYIGKEYEVDPSYFILFAINKGKKEDERYV